jgi:YidC/Oxa1 family membrane protein insertase
MDRKSIIILVVSFILLMAWYPLIVNRLYPPRPLPPGSTNIVSSPYADTNAPLTVTTQAVPSMAQAPATPQIPFVTEPSAPEELLEVTNALAHFTFSSHGGGIKQIELLKYPNAVTARNKTSTNEVATLNTYTRVPTLAVLGAKP